MVIGPADGSNRSENILETWCENILQTWNAILGEIGMQGKRNIFLGTSLPAVVLNIVFVSRH